MEILSTEKVTNNKFLNYYESDVKYKTGKTGKYYFASRNDISSLAMNNINGVPKNAVTVVGTLDDKIVLIKQFRVPVGDYLYELPSGLIEENESPEEAAIREMKEETGFEVVKPTFITNPCFTSPGMSDETNILVFCDLIGEPSTDGNEESEDIEICVCDKNEVKRILNEEKISATCQMVLMMYMGVMANCGLQKE